MTEIYTAGRQAAGLDIAKAVPVTGKAGTISTHHVRTAHGSRNNFSDRDSRALSGYRAADAWPLRSTGSRIPESFNAMIVRGEPTLQPRLRDVPVRMPYPPRPIQGSSSKTRKAGQGPLLRHGDVRTPFRSLGRHFG